MIFLDLELKFKLNDTEVFMIGM